MIVCPRMYESCHVCEDQWNINYKIMHVSMNSYTPTPELHSVITGRLISTLPLAVNAAAPVRLVKTHALNKTCSNGRLKHIVPAYEVAKWVNYMTVAGVQPFGAPLELTSSPGTTIPP